MFIAQDMLPFLQQLLQGCNMRLKIVIVLNQQNKVVAI